MGKREKIILLLIIIICVILVTCIIIYNKEIYIQYYVYKLNNNDLNNNWYNAEKIEKMKTNNPNLIYKIQKNMAEYYYKCIINNYNKNEASNKLKKYINDEIKSKILNNVIDDPENYINSYFCIASEDDIEKLLDCKKREVVYCTLNILITKGFSSNRYYKKQIAKKEFYFKGICILELSKNDYYDDNVYNQIIELLNDPSLCEYASIYVQKQRKITQKLKETIKMASKSSDKTVSDIAKNLNALFGDDPNSD